MLKERKMKILLLILALGFTGTIYAEAYCDNSTSGECKKDVYQPQSNE
jgi:hypothetical protein